MLRLSIILLAMLFAAVVATPSQAAVCARKIGKDQDTGGIRAFHLASDGALLIGGQKGLFWRDGDKLIPIGQDRDTGGIDTLHQASDGALLIGAERGLSRRDGDKLIPIGKDQSARRITAFHPAGDGALLIGAERGLFRRDGDKLIPIGIDQNAGQIFAFHPGQRRRAADRCGDGPVSARWRQANPDRQGPELPARLTMPFTRPSTAPC